jgi:release factor glutamine methyltransferase
MAHTLAAPELLRWRRQQLMAGGEESQLDWLLDLEGGVSWQALQKLRLDPECHVSLAQPLERLALLWQKHLSSDEPLQYLVGRCPWRDLELEVAPGVLIPRQETELMLELARRLLGADAQQRSTPWADLGTGSGCLALALARAWPQSRGWAVDCSSEALSIASRNINRYDQGDRVELLQGSWWEPLRPWFGRLELVVSNPPYIPTAVWRTLEPQVRNFEPALALDGGGDGLDAIRVIAAGAAEGLTPGGWLLLEHHHDQSVPVLQVLAAAGLENLQAHPDLEGVQRFASGRRPKTA